MTTLFRFALVAMAVVSREISSETRTSFYLEPGRVVVYDDISGVDVVPKSLGDSVPDSLITTVPFLLKDGYVLIDAVVDNRRGMLLVDIGAGPVVLNRMYVRPGLNGTIDTVTNTNFSASPLVHGSSEPAVVHQIQIGTFPITLATTGWQRVVELQAPAVYGYHTGMQFMGRPILGFLGLTALAGVETIIDYPRHRVTFVRLDADGLARTNVPFNKKDRIPLVRMKSGQQYGVMGRPREDLDSLLYLVDTGFPFNTISTRTRRWLKSHLQASDPFVARGNDTTVQYDCWQLDTLRIGPGVYERQPVCHWGTGTPDALGYPWLQSLGIVGFNFRTRTLTVYGDQ